jgi:hypothetical protein
MCDVPWRVGGERARRPRTRRWAPARPAAAAPRPPQVKLGQMGELEKELEKYRRQQKEAEAKKAAAGIWGYIAGTPTGP